MQIKKNIKPVVFGFLIGIGFSQLTVFHAVPCGETDNKGSLTLSDEQYQVLRKLLVVFGSLY